MKTRSLLLLFCLFLGTGSLYSQSSDARRMAALEQDVQALRAQVGKMVLAIEELQRENQRLRQQVNASKNNADTVTLSQLNRSLAALRSDLQDADAAQSREIAERVAGQLEQLAANTQSALDALAKSVEARPQVMQEISFSEDYPKEGVAYTIKSGDTLSSIAKRHNSTVKDIQNANRIADPTKIQAGQTIFIPQSSGSE